MGNYFHVFHGLCWTINFDFLQRQTFFLYVEVNYRLKINYPRKLEHGKIIKSTVYRLVLNKCFQKINHQSKTALWVVSPDQLPFRRLPFIILVNRNTYVYNHIYYAVITFQSTNNTTTNKTSCPMAVFLDNMIVKLGQTRSYDNQGQIIYQ